MSHQKICIRQKPSNIQSEDVMEEQTSIDKLYQQWVGKDDLSQLDEEIETELEKIIN